MIRRQLLSFAVIGVSVNMSLYTVYLLLTRTLMGSRAAMTLTYCSAVLIGFALNSRVTFRFDGANRSALLRYIGAYSIGYAINFTGLWLLVDHCGAPHELVQGGMTLCLPAVLFLLQRYWVFRSRGSCHPARCAGPVQ
jgi:putative flippase GtrA